MLCSKERSNQLRPIFSTIYIFFRTIFLLINYSLRDPNYIRPRIFLLLRLPFATSFRDTHLRPHFATHIHDSHSRLTFATPISDSRSRIHSRLPIAPPTATRSFLLRLPSWDSPTDGRTVLTPQHHFPSVPTLTLIKIFGTFSLSWPLPIATTHHHAHHP